MAIIPILVLGLSFAIVGSGNRLAWSGVCFAAIALYIALSLLGAFPFERTGEYRLPPHRSVLQVLAGFVGLGLLLLPLWAVFFRRWRAGDRP